MQINSLKATYIHLVIQKCTNFCIQVPFTVIKTPFSLLCSSGAYTVDMKFIIYEHEAQRYAFSLLYLYGTIKCIRYVL